MIVLDASVLIAALNGTDHHHQAGKAVLERDTDFSVHVVTLAEVLVGGVRIGRGQAMRERIRDLGARELQRLDDEAITLARLRVETSLKIPDCCPLMVAEHLGVRLATFDHRLARAARDRELEVLGADA